MVIGLSSFAMPGMPRNVKTTTDSTSASKTNLPRLSARCGSRSRSTAATKAIFARTIRRKKIQTSRFFHISVMRRLWLQGGSFLFRAVVVWRWHMT